MAIFSYSTVQTQIDSTWVGQVQEPCEVEGIDNDTCWNTSGWVGPLTDTLTAGFATSSCAVGCKFVVVYYERFDTSNVNCFQSEDSTHYADNVVIRHKPYIGGMFWLNERDKDCYECDTKDLEHYFVEEYFKKKVEDSPELINSFTETFEIISNDTIRKLEKAFNSSYYTSSKCIDSLGNSCGPDIEVCCETAFTVHSAIGDTSNRQIDSVTFYSTQDNDYCLAPCNEDCEATTGSINSVFGDCNIPCNDGPWTPDTSGMIDISHLSEDCPYLEMNIFFSYREPNPPCPESYKDLKFDSIQYNGPDSCILRIEYTDLANYINGWMLKYKATQDLDILDCRDEFRLINSICLTGYDTVNNTGLGACFPAGPEFYGCCWAEYMICRTGQNEYTYTKIDGSAVLGDTCDFNVAVCYTVCEEMSGLYAPNKDDLYGDHSMEDLFNTLHSFEKAKSFAVNSEKSAEALKKQFDDDVELLIYDLFGKMIGTKYDLPYMYSKLNRGVYFIMEKDRDRVVSITKVYVEK